MSQTRTQNFQVLCFVTGKFWAYYFHMHSSAYISVCVSERCERISSGLMEKWRIGASFSGNLFEKAVFCVHVKSPHEFYHIPIALLNVCSV